METLFVYIVGALLYGGLEILWRGWTHWTMLLCGGACFSVMYRISAAALSLPKKCLLCSAAITTAEFVTGCIVNLRFNMAVWDYSSQPCNLMGQICLPFSLMWLALSLPGLWLCALLRRGLKKADFFSRWRETPKSP